MPSARDDVLLFGRASEMLDAKHDSSLAKLTEVGKALDFLSIFLI